MPQAGIHALVGTTVKKIAPKKEWLLLGIILGNMLPDLDNLVVAGATLFGGRDAQEALHDLHRTFSHSVFTIIAIWIVFWLIGTTTKRERWTNLGLGLGIGTGMHILLDLVAWFNGVYVLWPIPFWLNLWEGYTPPAWLDNFLEPAEFLGFGLFLYALRHFARQHNTDADFLKTLNVWIIVEAVLLVVFTPLFYMEMPKIMFTIYGAFYLISLIAAFSVTIRMRATVASLG